MQMSREEQERLLYGIRHQSLASALQNVQSITSKSGRAVNVMFIASKSTDIAKTLSRSIKGYDLTLLDSDQPIFSIHMKQRQGETTRDEPLEEIKALCLQSEIDSIYMIISDYKTSIFKRTIVRLVNKKYPLLSRVFLRDMELWKLFQSLKRTKNIRTKVYKILYASRISNELQEKDLKWTARDIEEVFEEVAQQNSWIKKIDFRSLTESMGIDEPVYELRFDAAISRDCIFKVKNNFSLFSEDIVFPLLRMVADRLGYLEVRSKKAYDVKPEPIVIKFPESVFKGEGWNTKFIDRMAEMPNVSVNEYHTNPYVHISLLDYQDGSSYGIWIVSEDALNIIPQGRATVASMARLLNHVYQRIREGEIADYAPIEIGRR